MLTDEKRQEYTELVATGREVLDRWAQARADRDRYQAERDTALDHVRRLCAQRDTVARAVRSFDPTGHDPAVVELLVEIREAFAIVEGQREAGETPC